MYSELSILDLVLHASLVVQLVLASLVLASIISWQIGRASCRERV